MSNQRSSSSGRRPRPGQPVQMIRGLDGEPFHGDDGCPVCAELAARGEPVYTQGADGELIEVVREAPPMIQIKVRGTATTYPYLPPEPQVRTVPVGCVVADLLEFLCAFDLDFRLTFPPGTLWARIRGELCEAGRVLHPGDEVAVYGRHDPEMSRLFIEYLVDRARS